MSGNVGEWCWDWYDDINTPSITASTPDTGASSGSSRVFRGGSWNFGADDCSVASRDGRNPDDLGNDTGFRVVRTAQ